MRKATISASTCVLAHTPALVRYGSKPFRESRRDGGFLPALEARLRSFEAAAAYPPNQVFIGNLPPQALRDIDPPWYEHRSPGAERTAPTGEIIPEDRFLALLKSADAFGLIDLSEDFCRTIGLEGAGSSRDFSGLGSADAELPLFFEGEAVGRIRSDHEEDDSLKAAVLLENLAAKASAFQALELLLAHPGVPGRDSLDFIIGCSEEAVGDRYQRGGGNLAKAVGEMAGLAQAGGADVKNFCAGPLQALIFAGSLVASGVFDHVAVVGGGSLPKLGMKASAHLERDMPILEDVLAGFAAWVSADGEGPRIRLDGTGFHRIGAGNAQQAILESLVAEPLGRLGLRITDVPVYATELHNPEITVPAGGGDVPRTNYRFIGALAALRGEIDRSEIDRFADDHGLPGFSPSQGHIASAVPALPHVLRRFTEDGLDRAFFLAKGSLFLGRMTRLSDGVSFLLDAG